MEELLTLRQRGSSRNSSKRKSKILTLKTGETLILDLGAKHGRCRQCHSQGQKGTTLSLRHAEMLNDGRINRNRQRRWKRWSKRLDLYSKFDVELRCNDL